jgi:hypothetical protein
MYQWSTTPANNATAGSINWAEGQAPSTVNDSARQMMADVATWFQSPEWLNYGLTPTYVSATQFTVAGNQTGIYSVGRRVKATVTAGTVYGTISASVFGSLTTVTATWDSGSLDSGVSEVDVGIMNPLHLSLPALTSLSLSSLAVSGSSQIPVTVTSSGGSTYQKFSSSSGAKHIGVIGNNFSVVNQANTAVLLSQDDSGNLTITGNITMNSDERLKTGWEPIQGDFVEGLASVKCGTYERVDIGDGKRHVGVGAQSLQQVLPEAVLEGAQGFLSVAYGNAALVAVIELSREILRLRGELREVRHLAGV